MSGSSSTTSTTRPARARTVAPQRRASHRRAVGTRCRPGCGPVNAPRWSAPAAVEPAPRRPRDTAPPGRRAHGLTRAAGWLAAVARALSPPGTGPASTRRRTSSGSTHPYGADLSQPAPPRMRAWAILALLAGVLVGLVALGVLLWRMAAGRNGGAGRLP